jgi:DNA-binding FadR family transcriptional regulator
MSIKYDIQPASLSAQIADAIREAIVEGRLKIDERLPTEQELADRFSVSRPTVREALKRLAARNLIRSRRGPTGGTFVNRPSEEEGRAELATTAALMVSLDVFSLPEVAEARSQLEQACVPLAVTNRRQAELDMMIAEVRRQEDPDLSDEEFCASDVRFHRALVDATHNPVLRFTMATVIEGLQPAANMVVYRFRERAPLVDQHRRLYEAIRDGDVHAAAVVLSEQMAYLRASYDKAQAWREARDRLEDVRHITVAGEEEVGAV